LEKSGRIIPGNVLKEKHQQAEDLSFVWESGLIKKGRANANPAFS
jgi:hypothetical protein